jgi:hypothetical protein
MSPSITTPAQPPAPLCIQCQHHVAQAPDKKPRTAGFVLGEHHYCSHPQLRHVIDGSATTCREARCFQYRCGPSGHLFEPAQLKLPRAAKAAA